MHYLCALLGLVTALVPSTISAQVAADTVPRRVWEQASRSNWHLRVIAVTGDTLLGRPRYSSGEPRIGGKPVPVQIARIDRRELHGNGALIGGLVGFVAFGLVGSGLASDADVADTAGADLLTTASLAAFGAIIGLFAGQAIAPGRVEWEPVWLPPPR